MRITSDLAKPTGHEINALGNYHISHYTVTRQACAATWSRKRRRKKKTAVIWERKLLNWNGLLYIIVIFSPYIPCNNCCLLPSSSTQLKMYVVINFWAKQVPPKSVTVCVCVHTYLSLCKESQCVCKLRDT